MPKCSAIIGKAVNYRPRGNVTWACEDTQRDAHALPRYGAGRGATVHAHCKSTHRRQQRPRRGTQSHAVLRLLQLRRPWPGPRANASPRGPRRPDSLDSREASPLSPGRPCRSLGHEVSGAVRLPAAGLHGHACDAATQATRPRMRRGHARRFAAIPSDTAAPCDRLCVTEIQIKQLALAALPQPSQSLTLAALAGTVRLAAPSRPSARPRPGSAVVDVVDVGVLAQ